MALAEPLAPGAIRLAGWRTSAGSHIRSAPGGTRWPGPGADDGSYGRSPGRRARPVNEHHGAAAPLASPARQGSATGTAMSSTAVRWLNRHERAGLPMAVSRPGRGQPSLQVRRRMAAAVRLDETCECRERRRKFRHGPALNSKRLVLAVAEGASRDRDQVDQSGQSSC